MHWIDWSILAVVICGVTSLAVITSRYNKSVADFLAGNRCAGRYVLGVSEGAAMMGAISVVMMFEMYYTAGFSAAWWAMMQLPIGVIIAVTGWVIYRFRQTRALTLGQFFELRYSRNFRIFSGSLAYLAGIVNYGIFPAVTAKFFIFYCGLPQTFNILGISVNTYPVLMATLLSISLFYVFLGGQIAVMVTDFVQGIFTSIVFLILIVFCISKFDWSNMISGLISTQQGEALLNPLAKGKNSDFSFLFWAIGAAALFFNNIGWQGRAGFNTSAKSPHEAVMAKVIGTWRQVIMTTVMILLPLVVLYVLNSSDYKLTTDAINASISKIGDVQIQKQMTVPVALTKILPVGIIGLFAAMMFAAMVTTDQPYLHSWGSILVQDVIMPIRNKPLTPGQHMWALRLSILGVAVFAFFFSLLFKQTTYILMFFQITGAIFLGGAGAVIIGGLYWPKGTTNAAWITMIVGSVLAVTGVLITRYVPGFPLTGMEMYGITMLIAGTIYVIVSLLSKRTCFDLDKMLHRGKYALKEDGWIEPKTGWRSLITSEFTFGDKLIYGAVLVWTFGMFGVFLVGTIYGLLFPISLSSWSKFWHGYIYVILFLGVVTVVWFAIGGTYDVRHIFKTLSTLKRNHLDDGRVVGNQNLADLSKAAQEIEKQKDDLKK
ncbi:MAG: sodium:solute symporter [Phycisphaerales bacterium]